VRNPQSRFSWVPALLLVVLCALGAQLWINAHGRRHVLPQFRESERALRSNGTEIHPRREGPKGAAGKRTGANSCENTFVTCDSIYFAAWAEPAIGACAFKTSKNGLPLPDPRCTPGGINPSVTIDTLNSPDWRTECVRNCETSEGRKESVYAWYKAAKPRGNGGENQICELDHLIPLELGGADGLGNIWPQCGPTGAAIEDRYFKLKDRVENYLAVQVRTARIPLVVAQRGIAEDWTQYLDEANRFCGKKRNCQAKENHHR